MANVAILHDVILTQRRSHSVDRHGDGVDLVDEVAQDLRGIEKGIGIVSGSSGVRAPCVEEVIQRGKLG